MKSVITILTLYLALSGCAFKSNEEKQQTFSNARLIRKTAAKVLEQNSLGNWVLIDDIEMPRGNFVFDQTIPVKGRVQFAHLYPKFKDTQCRGLGYEITYEKKQKIVSPKIRLVPFVNGIERSNDHLVLNHDDVLNVAVYSEYEPISEFVETERLPNEYVKSLQPSNICQYACPQARVKPSRKLKYMGPGFSCFYPILGNGSDIPTVLTTDFWFLAGQLEDEITRDRYIKWITDCDAVQDNSDLEDYYRQAFEGTCSYGSRRIMMREWYFVEVKIPYQSPTYNIDNFSQIVRATTETQNSGLLDQPITPIRAWTN